MECTCWSLYFEETLNYVITQIKTLAMHSALRVPEFMNGIVLTGYAPFIPEELEGIMEKQYEYF